VRNPLLPLSPRLALNPSPPASQPFGRPCGPSQNRRASEWDLKEESEREVELSKIKPSQDSFPLSHTHTHMQVYPAYRSRSDGHSRLPHSRLCYYDCEVLTEFDSGLHISFNMRWCEIHSYTFYSLTERRTLLFPVCTLFSIAFLSV